MAPPNRTTPEQLTWLTSLLPQFVERQDEKRLPEFWSMLDHSWFTRWPEPGIAEAELEPHDHPSRKAATDALSHRKSYLRNWFNNRAVNKRKVSVKVQPLKTSTRSHQPVEVYSRQFYTEKIKPLVAAEVSEKNIPQNQKLNVVKTLTRAAFEAEPPEVREAIFAQASALRAENAARRLQARGEADTSPQGYTAAIESTAFVLDSFIRDLAERTGWAFSVVGGGPDPMNGGRIQTISFHEGRNLLGATFKKAHVSFEDSVLKPYVQFLNQIYPAGVCAARALPNPSTDDSLFRFPTHGSLPNNESDTSAPSSPPVTGGFITQPDPVHARDAPDTREASLQVTSPPSFTSPLLNPDITTLDGSRNSSYTNSVTGSPHMVPDPFTNTLAHEDMSNIDPLLRDVPPPPRLPVPLTVASFAFPPTPVSVPPPPAVSSAASAFVDPPLPALNIPPIEDNSMTSQMTPRNDATWSKEVVMAVKVADAKAARLAAATAVRNAAGIKPKTVGKVATAQKRTAEKKTATEPSNVSPILQQRPQRIRKAVASKEVVTLTKDPKENNSDENARPAKKRRTR